jgi:hypothetical protein
LSLPALAATDPAAIQNRTLLKWADGAMALLLALLSLACAGRSLQAMQEIPADAVAAVTPAATSAPEATMTTDRRTGMP